jgi:dipeptidyl aminopeptidase/acylaminoacyl peptidase
MVDLRETASRRPDMRALFKELMPDYQEDPEAAMTRRSALAWPNALTVPTLILHGDADPRVPVDHSIRLHAALQEHGTEAKLHIYERDAHLLLLNRSDYLERIHRWLDIHRGVRAAEQT